MEGTGAGVRILLFSEITLCKYNVSTILSPIVAFPKGQNNNNNDRLFNLFAAQTELQGGSLITYNYFGIMTRKYNC